MYVLGLDIGYSNLKIAHGNIGQNPKCQVVPSGAAPEDRIPQGIRISDQGVSVTLGHELWRVGLSHACFDQWVRSLHTDYTQTLAYGALYYGAMAMTGMSEIDKVITGLPVSLWGDKKHAEALVSRLCGTHRIHEDKEVTVHSVEVIPQPLGAFLSAYWQANEDAKLLSEGRILVIDPGFYSVDWVVVEAGGLRKSGSGTSLNAMSVLLKETSRLIQDEKDGVITVERIEEVLRNGKSDTYLFGSSMDLRPYLERSAGSIAHLALEELRESIRREVGSVDMVIIAGGGGNYFKPAIETLFGKSRIFIEKQPELANAKGFFFYGEM